MAENSVGLQPNVACEFKRAGFLERRNDWNIAADWAATKPVIDENTGDWPVVTKTNRAGNRNSLEKTRSWWRSQLGSGSVNSAVDLLVQHFKKIAPLEFSRSVRPKVDTKLRPSLLPKLGEQG